MTVPTGTILKVVATMLWDDGNVMQNVFACDIVGGAGPYDEADVIDDLVTWVEDMYTTLNAQITHLVDGSQVQVYRWDAVGGDFDEVGSDPWTWTPSQATEALPYGVAGLLNAKSVDADSSAKKYLGGICEGSSVDGVWETVMLAAMVNFGGEWVQSFVGAITGATFNPGVWSVKDSLLNAFVATVIIPTTPAYQRRRKQGVGI